MIGENATLINIQFVHVFIKLTLPWSLLYRLQRQKIRAVNRLSPKDVGSFMRVSTITYKHLFTLFGWLTKDRNEARFSLLRGWKSCWKLNGFPSSPSVALFFKDQLEYRQNSPFLAIWFLVNIITKTQLYCTLICLYQMLYEFAANGLLIWKLLLRKLVNYK